VGARTKPVFPWQLPLLGGIEIFGLIAQLVSGEAAFALLGLPSWNSWALSLFLLAAPIASAAVIIQSPRDRANVTAAATIVVTAVVSGTLNFIWIGSEFPEFHFAQVVAYSICPLLLLYWIGYDIYIKTVEWRS
jgi:predicted permease